MSSGGVRLKASRKKIEKAQLMRHKAIIFFLPKADTCAVRATCI